MTFEAVMIAFFAFAVGALVMVLFYGVDNDDNDEPPLTGR